MSWKVLGIISIIINILLIIFLGYLFNVGSDWLNNDNECAINVCGGYESYYYNDITKMCYCYVGEDLMHQEYIK